MSEGKHVATENALMAARVILSCVPASREQIQDAAAVIDEAFPGYVSLVEALEKIVAQTCGCNRPVDQSWHSDRCPKGIAEAALKLAKGDV